MAGRPRVDNFLGFRGGGPPRGRRGAIGTAGALSAATYYYIKLPPSYIVVLPILYGSGLSPEPRNPGLSFPVLEGCPGRKE